jgi:hypothetical protein
MDATREQAQYLIDAVNDALQTPTHYRDDTPVPAKGDTPPVPQPDSRRVPAWAVSAPAPSGSAARSGWPPKGSPRSP